MTYQTEQAIHVEKLSVQYDNNIALRGVDLDVPEKDYIGIIGPNGGGKSTLLKSIMGLVKPDEGTIKIFGRSPKVSRHLIGYVPQHAEFDRNFPMSVLEVVLTGMLERGIRPFRKFTESEKERAYDLLSKVGINELAKNHISALSGGEFQKMLIARALASEPKILLLDEPTASVDASSRANIYDLLEEINKDATIVLVTHDLLAISSRVKRLACLNENLIYHGEPELNDETVRNLYGCPVDLIAHGVPHRVLKEHNGGSEK
jgi:zinc transport system ATP-binding protein